MNHSTLKWTQSVARSTALVCLLSGALLSAATWQAQGPAPITGGGNVQGMVNPSNPQDGAIQAIATHPTDANTIYVAAVNGGVWKTVDGGVNWTPLTDSESSLSLGSLALDPTDTSSKTLIAGSANVSSLSSIGGPRSGVLYSTDGGANWSTLGGATLTNMDIRGVAARGQTLLAATSQAFYRSADRGQTWTAAPTGLPATGMFRALTGDAADANVLYTVDTATGVYRSADAGATWSNITGMLTNFTADIQNAKISVGAKSTVFLEVINKPAEVEVANVFLSRDNGATWTGMALPGTTEKDPATGASRFYGPTGSQGNLHSSFAADPTNPNLVYIAGDTQPFAEGLTSGGVGYSGRMFRGDASAPAESQWTYLVVNFTSNGSAPHADSRAMAFDAAGNLLEGDDGGIYKRTSPQTTNGGWFSIMGNLQVSEIHSIAYDRLTKTLLSGNQDNGAAAQDTAGGLSWTEVAGGDGGQVAINNSSSPEFSVRYYSSQKLGGFTHQKIDKNNQTVDRNSPALMVGKVDLTTHAASKGEDLANDEEEDEEGESISFYPIITLNRIDQSRISISSQRVYIGTDDPSAALSNTINLTDLNSTNFTEITAVDWGHKDNPNLMVVGSDDGSLYLSTTSAPGSFTRLDAYRGATARSIRIHPANAQTLFVADGTTIWRSTDSGASWTSLAPGLEKLGARELRTLQFVTKGGANALVVGTLGGFLGCLVDTNPDTWFRFAAGIPNVLVFDSKYDPIDDVLVAGTLGRGAWTLAAASTAIATASGGGPVAGANTAPVLKVPATLTSALGSPVNFQASAVDTDIPEQKLTYSLGGTPPTGATIDAATGAFTWTPAASGTTAITVTVTDSGTPALSDTKTVNIVVTDGQSKNTAPVMEPIENKSVEVGALVTIVANVTDTDVPKQTLTFNLEPGAPAGATVNAQNGTFSWRPTAADIGPGATFTLKVTDSGTPPLSDSKTFVIAVSGSTPVPKNQPPSLATITNRNTKVGQPVAFTATATDDDTPAQTLSYSLDSGSPAGAAIDASSGAFSWTPTAAQGDSTNVITVIVTDSGTPQLSDRKSFVVTVSQAPAAPSLNTPPVINVITNRSIQALELTSFTVRAKDNDVPAQTLKYTITSGAPDDAVLDEATGEFSWTPTAAQAGTTNIITITVTDNGVPALSDSQTFIITVAPPEAALPKNRAPQFLALADPTASVGTLLSFTAKADDTDRPVQKLTFSLGAGAPDGAAIDPDSGVFTWTPTKAGSYSVVLKVTDNGTPNLSDTASLNITVTAGAVVGTQTSLTASISNTGSLSLRVSGATVGKNYVLEASADLVTWTPVNTATAAVSESFDLSDPAAATLPQRFYRLRAGN